MTRTRSIIAIVLAVLAALVVFRSVERLAAYRDVVEIRLAESPGDLADMLRNARIREIKEFAIIARHAGEWVSAGGFRAAEASVYECGANISINA